MPSAQTLNIDAFSGPVLVVRPAVQGQMIEPGHCDYEAARRLCDLASPTAVTSLVRDNDLLDPAGATWEDCEWR